MNHPSIWLITACVALTTGAGLCRNPNKVPPAPAVFAKLQQAVAAAGKQVEPSLALVKVEKDNAGSSAPMVIRGMTIQRSAGSPSACGIVLTSTGHVLAPGLLKPDQDQRITVLIGENEYVARAVKADETLGMTLLKLDSAETFVPLDIAAGADLAVGEWAVVIKSTDEDFDYQKLVTPAICQGEKAGLYRQFILNESLAAFSGAVVVNLSGQLVGLVDKGTVLAINDLREDLRRLLTDLDGNLSPEDEKKKKGWLGAALVPVNKEFAKARKLSPGSLQIVHVAKDSPAAAAGLRAGDLIVALNGKPLRLAGDRAMEYFTKSLHPRTGEKFTVTALREDRQADFSGAFTRAPEPETLLAEDLGVAVSGITDSGYFSQNLATDRGVLVTDVIKGSPAANSGTLRQTLISENDIIIELAGQPTPDLAAFGKVLETIRRDHPPVVLVKYYRGQLTGYAGLNLALGEKDNGNKQ
jgi:S1-C subfamily serine protease